MTLHGRTRGLAGIFSRKKSTYGLILPGDFQPIPNRRIVKRKSQDCFAPSKMDSWELPQYESLFQHLIETQDDVYRRRLSSTASSDYYSNKSHNDSESKGSSGPFTRLHAWFKEIIHSLHGSGEYDLGGDNVVEGIPIDVCEKLHYVHIYY